jgi:hypothetical protein
MRILKKVRTYVCPNPKCEKPFKKLIVVYDKSKTPAEIFYGCPNCFFKLDPTITDSLKKIEKFVEVEISSSLVSEHEIISNCPHYLGYLSTHFSESLISKQCLDCKKMSECILNCNDEKKVIEDDYVA